MADPLWFRAVPTHEPGTDDAVQARLAAQSQRAWGTGSRPMSGALLAGILFDEAGNRMTPTYRYYVSAPLVRGGSGGRELRFPAHDLETLVRKAVADRLRESVWVSNTLVGEANAQPSKVLIDAAGKSRSR